MGSYLSQLYDTAYDYYLEDVIVEAQQVSAVNEDAEESYHAQVAVLEDGLAQYFKGCRKMREMRG